MLEWLAPLGGIILVDLVLSGDNALVIGAAAAGLPRQQRWWAIILGGGGAIVLRIIFAIIATVLLGLPLLQAIGGLILLFIAIRLLADRNAHQETHATTTNNGATRGKSFFAAMLTILVADATMSLDNVLAIGALANGQFAVLIIGLLISIALLLAGSALVSELISRLPWLLDIASLVLAWTAANMILEDQNVKPFLEHPSWLPYLVHGIALAIVLVADLYLRWRDSKQAKAGVIKE